MLTIQKLDWIRNNTCEKFQDDINLINWLTRCSYLKDVKKQLDKEIEQGILKDSKYISEQKYINYLINNY